MICNINKGIFFSSWNLLQTLTCILQGAKSHSYSYRLFRKNNFKNLPGKTGPDHSSFRSFFSVARPKIYSLVFTAAPVLCPAQPAPIKLQFIVILKRERVTLGHHRSAGLRKKRHPWCPQQILALKANVYLRQILVGAGKRGMKKHPPIGCRPTGNSNTWFCFSRASGNQVSKFFWKLGKSLWLRPEPDFFTPQKSCNFPIFH